MKPYEIMKFLRQKLDRFVYKQKGSGIVVDIIFKPMRSIATSVLKKVVKPLSKKVLESGIRQKKLLKKSGDLLLIMKQLLASKFNKGKTTTRQSIPIKQEESVDMILNRSISGSEITKRRKICKLII